MPERNKKRRPPATTTTIRQRRRRRNASRNEEEKRTPTVSVVIAHRPFLPQCVPAAAASTAVNVNQLLMLLFRCCCSSSSYGRVVVGPFNWLSPPFRYHVVAEMSLFPLHNFSDSTSQRNTSVHWDRARRPRTRSGPVSSWETATIEYRAGPSTGPFGLMLLSTEWYVERRTRTATNSPVRSASQTSLEIQYVNNKSKFTLWFQPFSEITI
jgi:hypothetical protein